MISLQKQSFESSKKAKKIYKKGTEEKYKINTFLKKRFAHDTNIYEIQFQLPEHQLQKVKQLHGIKKL